MINICDSELDDELYDLRLSFSIIFLSNACTNLNFGRQQNMEESIFTIYVS